jgi:hypothetical protein
MASWQSGDKHWHTKFFIKTELPKLKIKDVDWDSASDPTPKLEYNCAGLAFGVEKWWEPKRIKAGKVLNPYAYWPDGLPKTPSIEAYIAAAELCKFQQCDKAEWDKFNGTKIILFHNQEHEFTHALRHVAGDKCLSKLGEYSDVEHSLGALDGDYYGSGRIYMKIRIDQN